MEPLVTRRVSVMDPLAAHRAIVMRPPPCVTQIARVSLTWSSHFELGTVF